MVNKRRAALDEARKVQVAIAREEAAGAIEGDLKAFIASDATRYAASEHCNFDGISPPETKAFCDQIGKQEAKKAAALKRDELDSKLAEVDHETIFGGPSSADPSRNPSPAFCRSSAMSPPRRARRFSLHRSIGERQSGLN